MSGVFLVNTRPRQRGSKPGAGSRAPRAGGNTPRFAWDRQKGPAEKEGVGPRGALGTDKARPELIITSRALGKGRPGAGGAGGRPRGK